MSYDTCGWSCNSIVWYWRVTRSLVSYDFICYMMSCREDWRVTRSLVSYDCHKAQIKFFLNWRVTRSLVSYDNILLYMLLNPLKIEGSPDHWWVTTYNYLLSGNKLKLKGHQIIGELRLLRACLSFFERIEGSPDHWWVTTSGSSQSTCPQNIEGSPDHWWVTT